MALGPTKLLKTEDLTTIHVDLIPIDDYPADSFTISHTTFLFVLHSKMCLRLLY